MTSSRRQQALVGTSPGELRRSSSTVVGLHLELVGWERSHHQIAFQYRIGGMTFTSSFWYEGVDLLDLEALYGATFMRKLYFHIAAFDINKLQSLRPQTISWGAFSDLATRRFAALWATVTHNVWGQWRYENSDPHYYGPAFTVSDETGNTELVELPADDGVSVLAFSGGGKDSLVAMKLLENAGIVFDSLSYSVSSYGSSTYQHQLSDYLLDGCAPHHRRRLWVFDDFLEVPDALMMEKDNRFTRVAAETPSSVFAALPFALRYGYRVLQVAHEHSADNSQVIWEQTGESINHSWGKSTHAEITLNTYIREELISGLCYYSILKPVGDVVIFNLLRRDMGLVERTHSCNNLKPWCCECPKCAYVWLNYMAWLPTEIVDTMFNGRNLLDSEANQRSYVQMLGLDSHLPFECIGTSEETRLAFELCRLKKLAGRAMDTYAGQASVSTVDVLHGCTRIAPPQQHFPAHIWRMVEPQFKEAAAAASRYCATLRGESGPNPI